jgi:type II secretory pathway pseudopilin PulG
VVPLKDITWKHVVVILAFLGLVAAMVSGGKDTAVLLVVGMAILGGIGVIAAQQASSSKSTEVVREQTNGVNARYLDMIEAQRREFAAMVELQRAQFVAIIESQGRMLAGSTVPPEVLALTPSPGMPPAMHDSITVDSAANGSTPGYSVHYPAAAGNERTDPS